jgi:hypothetical protein
MEHPLYGCGIHYKQTGARWKAGCGKAFVYHELLTDGNLKLTHVQ